MKMKRKSWSRLDQAVSWLILGLACAGGGVGSGANGEQNEMASHHVAPNPVPYTHSFRVGLRFENGEVTVTSLQRVAMRAPASAPGQPADDQSGVWVELRAEGGRLLYHLTLRTPHLDSLEAFEDEKTGAIRRVPTKPRMAKLDVILPDLPDASEFVLHGAKNMRKSDAASVPLLKMPMSELRRKATQPPRPSSNDPRIR
jgi:hypothetical protein